MPTTDDLIEELLRLCELDRAAAMERDEALSRRIAALESSRWSSRLARWIHLLTGH